MFLWIAVAQAAELDVVRAALATDDRTDFSRSPWAYDAEALRARFGDRTIDLVASFLPDYDVGYDAANTLLELDRDRGLVLVLGSVGRSDRNVQHVGFAEVLRVWEATGVVPHRQEAHDASVTVLGLHEGHADAQVEALQVLGLSGTAVDLGVLGPWKTPSEPIPMWRERLRHAAFASSARLGDEAAITAVIRALEAGRKAELTFARNLETHAWTVDAAFAANPRMVPALCGLVAHPVPAPDGHMLPPSVAQEAVTGLMRAAPAGPGAPDPATWKRWCADVTR